MKTILPLLIGLALATPPIAWFAAQQSTATLGYFHCRAAGLPLGLVAGLLGVIACLAAGGLSLRNRQAGLKFSARIGLGLAGIFALACLFTIAATIMVPPCAR